MRIRRALCVIVLLAACRGPALADQTDPRLGPLFDMLHAAADPAEEQTIEQQIWTIWLEAPNPEVQARMDDGVAAMNVGDYTTALDDFDQVVTLAPDYAEGWNKRATVRYLLDDFQGSLADIDATLNLEPRHFGALSGRGLVYVKLGDLERALAAFEDTLRISPQMPGPRANIEAIRQALGQQGI
jgi:tetratricopeptide (TPR) repeat protein